MNLSQKTFTQNELDLIHKKAIELGFSDVRFIPAKDPDDQWQKKYREYLKKGFHASMKYLENIQSKFSIKKIYQPVETVAVFSLPYFFNDETSFENDLPAGNIVQKKHKYTVSRFASGRDYHLVVKEKLEALIFAIGLHGRIVCDTTPLPERYFGAVSGLGFIGKNAMLIGPETGSYFFLAFILYDRGLPPASLEPPENSDFTSPYVFTKSNSYDFQANIHKFCGDCDKCVKACPGGALDGSGFLNSRKCYSFWSIENKLDIIQAKFRKMDSVFGCDICQDVCPYNAKPFTTADVNFKTSEVSHRVMDGDFENLSLEGTSYERTGIKGLKRNLEYLKNLSGA